LLGFIPIMGILAPKGEAKGEANGLEKGELTIMFIN
jgi:hypothetical protein